MNLRDGVNSRWVENSDCTNPFAIHRGWIAEDAGRIAGMGDRNRGNLALICGVPTNHN